MGINQENATKEAKRLFAANASTSPGTLRRLAPDKPSPGMTRSAREALLRAEAYSWYFCHSDLRPEHVLLGISDLSARAAGRLLEEMGANISLLKRRVVSLMAHEYSQGEAIPGMGEALDRGLRRIVSLNLEARSHLDALSRLSGMTPVRPLRTTTIVHMVLVAYLADFLCIQVPFQRYVLKEIVLQLAERSGTLDQEITATIIANGAQHLRSQVREAIESIWFQEYRLLDEILSDAEYDLIGADIEDLWWAHSEEIALDELFNAALADHRRQQVLSLQTRRNEIAKRIASVDRNLHETVKQCFVRRSASA